MTDDELVLLELSDPLLERSEGSDDSSTADESEQDGESFGVSEATYYGRCPDCYDPDEGEYERTGEITFQLDPDPDSLRYFGDCSDCGDRFSLTPTAVSVDRYDPSL